MKNYSFLDTILLVNGIHISGFDEGDDVISVGRTNDCASHKTGNDGEMTVSVSADKTGSFTFKLMQTSLSNAYLSGLVNAQENGLFVPISVQFKDTKGSDIAFGTQGYITKPADMSRGQTAGSQEWKVTVESLYLLHIADAV